MRGPHVVPSLRAQKFSDRPIDRDWITGGLHAAKCDVSLSVGEELAAQVHVGLRRILVLVETLGRRLPDVDLRARNRPSRRILEPRLDEQRRPRRRGPHDGAAIYRDRRVHAPEGPEQAGVRLGLPVVAVVEEAHERGEAERARNQHRLVVIVGRVPAELYDVAGRGAQLVLGQPHLAGEVVHMAHERRHDLPEPRVRCPFQLAQYRSGNVLLLLDDHGVAPEIKGRSGASPRAAGRGAVFGIGRLSPPSTETARDLATMPLVRGVCRPCAAEAPDRLRLAATPAT